MDRFTKVKDQTERQGKSLSFFFEKIPHEIQKREKNGEKTRMD